MTFRQIPSRVGLVALLTASTAAAAQQATLVVENGRVIVGDGTVLERGTVVVAGERILAVTAEPVGAPDARRIDASGKTVLPGLIDAHVHLLVDPRNPIQPGSDHPHRAPPPATVSDSLARAYLDDELPQKLRSGGAAGLRHRCSNADCSAVPFRHARVSAIF